MESKKRADLSNVGELYSAVGTDVGRQQAALPLADLGHSLQQLVEPVYISFAINRKPDTVKTGKSATKKPEILDMSVCCLDSLG